MGSGGKRGGGGEWERGGMGVFVPFITGGTPPVGRFQETQGCEGVGVKTKIFRLPFPEAVNIIRNS
ncbi:MAG: hypothetical protein DSM106950_35100 [Stigonema ocellatum SAG 48.90 = DSM 106950]|nr:hypothetical protein [Stigonema ocellatum SAG 48.90 = DSM 106950]